MKHAKPWTEEVTFVSCPYCKLHSMLEDVVWTEKEEVNCMKCGETFYLTDLDYP